MPAWLFFPLAFLVCLAGLGVVLNTHPVRSAMCLVATLFLLAVFFIFLDASFVAALQVIVYAGAIMVVFLFVIMLLNLTDDEPQRRRLSWQVTTVLSASLFALGLLYVLRQGGALVPGPGMAAPLATGYGSIQSVGVSLFTTYVLPFEITGLLMLAAVIGAVVLARKKIA
ncbi:MAG TPA: NADH-quinone oxidoreductase subunit J [Candidatus Dormibacteraeota bacterium]|nr:NADH-quinone oxidoreductase subunit J [Candidatus Dormibacteraeota bacterium]